MTVDTPAANLREARAAGAEVVRVPGLISDAAARMNQDRRRTPMFDTGSGFKYLPI